MMPRLPKCGNKIPKACEIAYVSDWYSWSPISIWLRSLSLPSLRTCFGGVPFTSYFRFSHLWQATNPYKMDPIPNQLFERILMLCSLLSAYSKRCTSGETLRSLSADSSWAGTDTRYVFLYAISLGWAQEKISKLQSDSSRGSFLTPAQQLPHKSIFSSLAHSYSSHLGKAAFDL